MKNNTKHHIYLALTSLDVKMFKRVEGKKELLEIIKQNKNILSK